MRWVKAMYLDTSALIKLLIDIPDEKPGRDKLIQFFNNTTGFHTTSLCFAEALGVLKVKCFYRKEISEKIYIKACGDLLWNKIEIDDVKIADFSTFTKAQKIIETHKIDLADAMQIVTIQEGKYSVLGPNSKTLLITADGGLAKAARAEDVQVWDCINESIPEQKEEQ